MLALWIPLELHHEESEDELLFTGHIIAADPAPVFSITTACLLWEAPAVVLLAQVEKDEEKKEEEEAAGSL